MNSGYRHESLTSFCWKHFFSLWSSRRWFAEEDGAAKLRLVELNDRKNNSQGRIFKNTKRNGKRNSEFKERMPFGSIGSIFFIVSSLVEERNRRGTE